MLGLIKRVVRRLARTSLQPAWETLDRFALGAMNVGGGSDLASSGELWLLRKLARELTATPVVLDVGANIGDYAFEAARILGSRAYVFCFEPDPTNCEHLRHRFHATPNVECIEAAAGARRGKAMLYADAVGSALSSLYDRDLEQFGLKMHPRAEVDVLTLDGFCREHGVASIDLLKLDVEGHELEVLQGAEGLLGRGAIRWIQFEFGGCNLDSRTYLRDFFHLLGHRYEIHRLLPGGMIRLSRATELSERFVTTNFVARLRSWEGDMRASSP